MNFTPRKTHLFLLTLLVGGCSYFSTEPDPDSPKIDLTQQQPAPVPQRDIGEVVYESSNGSVQLFSLDDGAENFDVDYQIPQQGQPAGEWRADGPFIEGSLTPLSSEDPSVEIYPFGDVVYAEATPAQLPQKPQYERQGQDTVVVYFGHDSVALNARSKDKLADVVRLYKDGGMMPITVEGHASVRANYPDETTRNAVNLRISMNRAFIVAKALMDAGVPAESIKLVARGDTVPPSVLNGKTQEEAARRVEISR
jgi:outer membrane protein OmpA-like peptidoglycan-associated protein